MNKELTEIKDVKKFYFQFILVSLIAIAIIIIAYSFFPDTLPFSFFEFWKITQTPIAWIKTFSPYLIFLAIVNLYKKYALSNKVKNDLLTKAHFSHYIRDCDPRTMILSDFKTSIRSGFLEEILYRWLIFYCAIIVVQFINYILFGFNDIPLIQYLYVYILVPLADYFSLHYIHDILYHPACWSIGAGVLISNGWFRQGHMYLGVMGWIHSWFFGIAMFYIMFMYGLFACIFLHFISNMIVFSMHTLYMKIKKDSFNKTNK